MSDEPKSDKHERPDSTRDRVTARIDAIEAAFRADLESLRREVADLEQSQDDDRRGLADVRQEVISLRSGQDKLAAEVGSMRAEQRGMVAQLAALSSRIPTGGAVVVAGSAAGVPGLVLLAVEVARYWASN